MAISFVATDGAAADTVNLPGSWQAMDLAIVYAFRDASTTTPSLPTGWTNLFTDAGSGTAQRAGFRYLRSGDTDIGTWTNATNVIVIILRDALGIGGLSSAAVSGTTARWAALTMQVTDGTSWVVLPGGSDNSTNANSVALGSTTNRSPSQVTMSLHTAEGVSSWAQTDKTVSGASVVTRSVSIEVVAADPDHPFPEGGVTTTGSGTTTNVQLPDLVSAGSKIVVAIRAATGGAIDWPSADWNEIKDEAPDASGDQVAVAWKAADGTEGGTTIAVTHASGKTAALAYSFVNAGIPTISTAATGTASPIDPPSFSPAGGSADYTWIALATADGEQSPFAPSIPSGYPSKTETVPFTSTGTIGTANTNVAVAASVRQTTAASENPGSFAVVLAGISGWSAYTIAIPFATPPAPSAFTPRAVIF